MAGPNRVIPPLRADGDGTFDSRYPLTDTFLIEHNADGTLKNAARPEDIPSEAAINAVVDANATVTDHETRLGRVEPTVSQSVRGGVTQPYIAPSEGVFLEDVGGSSALLFNNSPAFAAAITAATTDTIAGNSAYSAIPIIINPGRWYIYEPIVQPRNGNTPDNMVHLIGRNYKSCIIEGHSSFPAGRALIEWDTTVSRVWNGLIANLNLRPALVDGCKAIWHKKNSAGITHTDYINEWLQCDFVNLLFESDNRYHPVNIDLDVGNRYARMWSLWHEPAPGGGTPSSLTNLYDTILVRTATTLGGVAPTGGNDNIGLGFCDLRDWHGPLRRGGNTQMFHGRTYRSTWDGGFSGGGHIAHASKIYAFKYSSSFTFQNYSFEGYNETAQIEMDTCEDVRIVNTGLGTPDTSGASVWGASQAKTLGQRVVPTSISTYVNRWFEATTAGTTGATQPAWPDVEGTTVNDGTVVWTARGRAMGVGLKLINSKQIRWDGRFARMGAPAFSTSKTVAVEIDALSDDVILDDFNVNVPTSGDGSTEVTLGGTTAQKVLLRGRAMESATERAYIVGWHPHHPDAVRSPKAITASYTANIAEKVISADATGGAVTVTLPSAVGIAGKVYVIRKTDASANVVTIDGAGSETINGATTVSLSTQYASARITSDGANWLRE